MASGALLRAVRVIDSLNQVAVGSVSTNKWPVCVAILNFLPFPDFQSLISDQLERLPATDGIGQHFSICKL